MDRILVVGVETVVGANFAACASAELTTLAVLGLSAIPGVQIGGVETHCTRVVTAEDATRWISQHGVREVVLCGPAACSSWAAPPESLNAAMSQEAALWADAAHQTGCRLTLISSDAVFCGPELFHEEGSTSHCRSTQAERLRTLERDVVQRCPAALIVRTNAYGWSPTGEAGWIEGQIAQLKQNRLINQDYIRHASPILATDLAQIIFRAWQEQLSGTFHIAGAERVSPHKFVQRLAASLELPWLSVERGATLDECPTAFGAGECALHTKSIRKAVCLAMPMISEGLDRLVEQSQNGFRDRLTAGMDQQTRRAA